MRKEGIYKLEDGQFKIEGYEILADFPHLIVNTKLDLSTFLLHLKQIEKEDKTLKYHLNIKMETLKNHLDEVVNALSKSPIKECIVIELLEEDIDEKILEEIVSKLLLNSVKISIDDFGTKSSNFDRLLKYKDIVDSIKIDRILWKNMPYVIEAIVKESKADIIAEKVETEEEIKSLEKMGIRLFQGWYFKSNFDKVIKKSRELELNDFEEETMSYLLKEAIKMTKKSGQIADIETLLENFKYLYFAYKLNVPVNSEEFSKIKNFTKSNKKISSDSLPIDITTTEIKLINYAIGELKILSEEIGDTLKSLRKAIITKDIDSIENIYIKFDKKVKNIEIDLKEKILDMKILVSTKYNPAIEGLLSRNNLRGVILNAHLEYKRSTGNYFVIGIVVPTLTEIYNALSYNFYEHAVKDILNILRRVFFSDTPIINYDLETFLVLKKNSNENSVKNIAKRLEGILNKHEILLNKKFYNLKSKIGYIYPTEDENIDDVVLKVESMIYELKHF
ncbi:MAG: EAL domain-containing protein [Hydrogenothermaceae bacterium]